MSKKERKKKDCYRWNEHPNHFENLIARKKEQKNNVEDYEMNKRKSIENYSFYEYC